MRKLVGAALLVGLFAGSAFAQDPEKVLAFNEAWGVYAEAAQSGNVSAAITASRNVLDKGRAIFPETDERIALLTLNHGTALRAGGDQEGAREQLKESLKIYEDIYGKSSVKLVPVLVEYADATAFADAAGEMTPFLRNTGAVLSRTLSVDEVGLWTDHITWTSMKAATSAAEAMMQQPEAAPFMQMIAPDTVQMRHAPIRFTIKQE